MAHQTRITPKLDILYFQSFDYRTHHFQPRFDQAPTVIPDGENPLASILVGRVLPHGVNTPLEEVQVTILLHLGR